MWVSEERAARSRDDGILPYLEFAEVLARDVGVGSVPGSSFFKEKENRYVRLHFAKKDETLNEALNRLSDIRNKLRH